MGAIGIIYNLDVADFSRYGRIIGYDDGNDANFQVQLGEDGPTGWRIAVMKVEAKTISQLHCHPDTLETFEPLSGTAVLFVADRDDCDNIKAFLLDRPVCLHKGIWHGVIALSRRAYIKITENSTVTRADFALKSRLTVDLVAEFPRAPERKG